MLRFRFEACQVLSNDQASVEETCSISGIPLDFQGQVSAAKALAQAWRCPRRRTDRGRPSIPPMNGRLVFMWLTNSTSHLHEIEAITVLGAFRVADMTAIKMSRPRGVSLGLVSRNKTGRSSIADGILPNHCPTISLHNQQPWLRLSPPDTTGSLP